MVCAHTFLNSCGLLHWIHLNKNCVDQIFLYVVRLLAQKNFWLLIVLPNHEQCNEIVENNNKKSSVLKIVILFVLLRVVIQVELHVTSSESSMSNLPNFTENISKYTANLVLFYNRRFASIIIMQSFTHYVATNAGNVMSRHIKLIFIPSRTQVIQMFPTLTDTFTFQIKYIFYNSIIVIILSWCMARWNK